VHPFSARWWRAVKRFSARIPLRIKLIATSLALVAIALAVISAVSITVFHGYLLHQADQQLQNFIDRAASPTRFAGQSERTGFRPLNRPGIGGFTQEILDSKGRLVAGQIPGPAVPADPAWLAAHAGQVVTLPARSGGGSWQVLTEPAYYLIERTPFAPPNETEPGIPAIIAYSLNPPPSQQNGTFVVAIDLGGIGHTIGTLTLIDLLVSGAVIVLLAGVGVALIRASLRPLAEIEQTAGAIAAGDLSRRVPDRDPRTEVGSLARSLNIMLSQIEQAFRERSESEARARISEERMRRFVADASHELRTPLSVIRGFAEYYRQRGGLREGELERMIRRVENEAARMGVLVEDLLLLARLDQQRPLQRGPVDLLALAADAAQDARLLAPGRDIQLSVGSAGPFLVLGDEARLRQIIRNLVNNALAHTPDGTPVELRLRTRPAEPAASGGHNGGAAGPAAPDAAIVLEVADSGPGLTPEQAERVFERFYRADAARTRKTGGTGLGLAIVAALAAAHGGTVAVDSRPGEGATFNITLPMAPEATGLVATR
jgi:two-component system, OmpR family, sensor kinase